MSSSEQFLAEITIKIDRLKSSIVDKIERIDVIQQDLQISEETDRSIDEQVNKLNMENLSHDMTISNLKYELALMKDQAARGGKSHIKMQSMVTNAETQVEANSQLYEWASYEITGLCQKIKIFCDGINESTNADIELDFMLREELRSYQAMIDDIALSNKCYQTSDKCELLHKVIRASRKQFDESCIFLANLEATIEDRSKLTLKSKNDPTRSKSYRGSASNRAQSRK